MSDNEEINVTYEQFIDAHSGWANGEGEQASDAGKRRAEMKEFQKETGLHGKAISHMRAGLKIKKDGDRQDWLRSMKELLPLVSDHIEGNGTPDMFNEADETQAEEPNEADNVIKAFDPDSADDQAMTGG